jgi:hypothetical protein
LQLFNNIKELIFDICYKESKEIVGKIWTIVFGMNQS